MGYREFLFDLFDQNIIFQSGKVMCEAMEFMSFPKGHEWQEVRSALDKVFTADKVREYMEVAKP